MSVMTAAALPVSDSQRADLERMAASKSLPHRQVDQARGLLWASDGVANDEIARRCGVDSDTVRRWRSRFAEQGVAGVGRIAKGRGRKPSLPAGTVEEVLRLTHEERPADGFTRWSTRTLAARVGIGKDAVAKIWADHNLRPWEVETATTRVSRRNSLAHKDRRRWHLHYTPTSSSWLNLVDRWLKELTDKRLRRGTLTSVNELTEAITTWAARWNTDPKPFIWKATAEDIIAKVQRGRATLHQIKTQTDH